MNKEKIKTKRCAIYTRKSSEEGLELEYNSLDAQRDAGEAYIQSQKHDGWKLVKKSYADGGISGGHMERPALQELIEDIKAKKIDIVVVYKVDRLSRSLGDFAQLMQLFEQHEVSFVSVTQQFNTSTSMGRLTLNVLLSFAQFEREVTGERIRDKVAASKKKGLWVGGIPPLGYNKEFKKLVINKNEAQRVIECCEIYLNSTGIIEATKKINKKGLKTKSYITSKGIIRPSKEFNAKQLHRLLTNPVYIGKIKHKENLYDGEHEPIIDLDLWQKVQSKLKENDVNNKHQKDVSKEDVSISNKIQHPLKGFVQNVGGYALIPSFTWKNQKLKDGTNKKTRYRYYTYQRVNLRGNQKNEAKNFNAGYLEQVVRCLFAEVVKRQETNDVQAKRKIDELTDLIKNSNQAQLQQIIQSLQPKITVDAELVELQIQKSNLHNFMEIQSIATTNEKNEFQLHSKVKFKDLEELIVISTEVSFTSKRGRTQILDKNGKSALCKFTNPKEELINAIVQGHYWKKKLEENSEYNLEKILEHYDLKKGYVHKLINTTYLAPDIKRIILQGKQPDNLQVQDLMVSLPLCWKEQKELLEF